MAHGRRNYVLPDPAAATDAPRAGKKTVLKAASVAVAVLLTVALVYSYPALSSSDGSSVADSSMLAKKPAAKKPVPVKFGDSITLKNAYNFYVTTTLNGSPSTAGYLGKNDAWKIVSPSGKKGALKYGDAVALVGQNNRFLTARYSAKVTCRAAKASPLGTWTLIGGTGGVFYGHQLVFKSEFGFLTGNPAGMRADAKQATQIEHFFVGKPGQEDGEPARPGLQYGMKITLTNDKREKLQSDKNGWVFIRPSAGKADGFDILSPLHREGPVSFGDKIVLRAHTGKMVSVNGQGELQATHRIPDLTCVFTVIGKTGIIHNDDSIALRSAAGYIAGAEGAQRAKLDTSGHFVPSHNFKVHFSTKFIVANPLKKTTSKKQ